MLDRDSLEFAIRIHAKGYKLLQWLETALKRGFIAPERMREGAEDQNSVVDWLARHLGNIPPETRPTPEELEPLGLFFATYLKTTFELKANPERRLFSPDAHCFCPMCSWMVQRPHLRPRKVESPDKKRADKLMLQTLLAWRAELALPVVPEAQLQSIVKGRETGRDLALCAYAFDLERRLEGRSKGTAVLALWRRFAWDGNGSPIKNYSLQAEKILEAQANLIEAMAETPGD